MIKGFLEDVKRKTGIVLVFGGIAGAATLGAGVFINEKEGDNRDRDIDQNQASIELLRQEIIDLRRDVHKKELTCKDLEHAYTIATLKGSHTFCKPRK